MNRCLLFLALLLLFSTSYGQEVERENLSKRQSFYFDPPQNTKLESSGYYYVDELGKTAERHGKWSFYNIDGEVVEERNYYRNELHGEVVKYYGDRKSVV